MGSNPSASPSEEPSRRDGRRFRFRPESNAALVTTGEAVTRLYPPAEEFDAAPPILREGQADGTVRDGAEAAVLARYVIATLEGALLMERLFASPASFEGTLAVLVEGLRPR